MVGNRSGLQRIKQAILTGMLVDIGRQENEEIGIRVPIFLANFLQNNSTNSQFIAVSSFTNSFPFFPRWVGEYCSDSKQVIHSHDLHISKLNERSWQLIKSFFLLRPSVPSCIFDELVSYI